MAKLYFRYGAMNCGKTRDLIKTHYNYMERNMKTIILKPGNDTKGGGTVVSRDSASLDTDFLISKTDNIYNIIGNYLIDNNLNCILVDEAQFLEPHHIEELTDVVDILDIPVICYGLRADFQSHLFPGSQRLFELADSIEEIKTVCDCGKKATQNVRFINGIVTFDGDQVAIDGENSITYTSKCRKCVKQLKRNLK